MENRKLQEFFDNVVWFGTPYVENFLNDNKSELCNYSSKDIWESRGLGFKAKAHFLVLENDYQYLLAYITSRFGALGTYSFVKDIYKITISHIDEAANLLRIWELTEPKYRSCFTVFGVSCWLLSNEVKREFEFIANKFQHLVCGRLARILLDESYINEQRLLGRKIEELLSELGYDEHRCLNSLINSPLCDGEN